MEHGPAVFGGSRRMASTPCPWGLVVRAAESSLLYRRGTGQGWGWREQGSAGVRMPRKGCGQELGQGVGSSSLDAQRPGPEPKPTGNVLGEIHCPPRSPQAIGALHCLGHTDRFRESMWSGWGRGERGTPPGPGGLLRGETTQAHPCSRMLRGQAWREAAKHELL